ncbi:MAG: substrate-binding domain-containing protein [Bradyrhizobium sp.]|uniref:substrate-binding domain-containing protein n=1 Tax=Bradyrhizobium sp. TaxID=376 RepID=UPI0025BEAD32|nr:substrate-binding domain-containing protein [Bradyrhizobium sp.]MBI5260465.1 substrate-binding domain-containing protein [Bradyrhizobium sp.]
MRLTLFAAAAILGLAASTSSQADDLKIALIYGKTGPLEAYAKQTETGLQLGFEYATKGSMTLDGRKIVIITKDDQGKPDLAKAALAEAYQDDKADIAIGTTSSAAALAILPVAEENKKILIVEPAVADQITGEKWNRYIFRTGRNSSQDAISNAVAIGKPGVTVATLAQDYAFGRDGVAAFKEALAKTGATLAAEEYAPTNTPDLTAVGQRLSDALKDKPGRKIIWVIWAGAGNPLAKLQDMDPKRYAIELSTGGNILPALAAYKALPGMEGATYYYYDIPKNPVNDWLLAEHKKRFNAPPDFFTAGGFAAAMAVVTAVTKAKSTDTEKLITAMEGMEFDTPKGKMVFRKDDHQALQSMYHFKVKVDPNVAWAVLEPVRELKIEDMNVPIRNKR